MLSEIRENKLRQFMLPQRTFVQAVQTREQATLLSNLWATTIAMAFDR
jgi:hypothetical protein